MSLERASEEVGRHCRDNQEKEEIHFAAMKVAGWTNAVSRKRDRLIPLKINYGKKVK